MHCYWLQCALHGQVGPVWAAGSPSSLCVSPDTPSRPPRANCRVQQSHFSPLRTEHITARRAVQGQRSRSGLCFPSGTARSVWLLDLLPDGGSPLCTVPEAGPGDGPGAKVCLIENQIPGCLIAEKCREEKEKYVKRHHFKI